MKRKYSSPQIIIFIIDKASIMRASLSRGEDKNEVEFQSKSFWGLSEEDDEEDDIGNFVAD